MSREMTGWLWVAGQAVLLVALVLLPGGDDWTTPGFLKAVATVFFFGGLALIAIAALNLGRALTPTPVPTKAGELKTSGLYGIVRHPIYTGVLAVVVGMTLGSGSFIKLAVAAATFVFFDRKSAWEEGQLRDRYPGYAAYASSTPKLIPGLKSGRN